MTSLKKNHQLFAALPQYLALRDEPPPCGGRAVCFLQKTLELPC